MGPTRASPNWSRQINKEHLETFSVSEDPEPGNRTLPASSLPTGRTWTVGQARTGSSQVRPAYRGVLALDAGGVEAHGGDALHLALDAEHALVVLLTRLRLRQVPGPQRDRTHHPSRNQDVGGGEDLGTALQRHILRLRGSVLVLTQFRKCPS